MHSPVPFAKYGCRDVSRALGPGASYSGYYRERS